MYKSISTSNILVCSIYIYGHFRHRNVQISLWFIHTSFGCVFQLITCERDHSSTHSNGRWGFQWEVPSITLTKSETIQRIDTEVWTIDNVDKISFCAEIITIGCAGAPPHIYRFCVSFIVFFRVLRHEHSSNGESHKDQWWLKRRVSTREESVG